MHRSNVHRAIHITVGIHSIHSLVRHLIHSRTRRRLLHYPTSTPRWRQPHHIHPHRHMFHQPHPTPQWNHHHHSRPRRQMFHQPAPTPRWSHPRHSRPHRQPDLSPQWGHPRPTALSWGTTNQHRAFIKQ